ncbi:MAG: methyl-accepting chemotaxis protein [Clostridia bacterium]|nr:methyl-accepting chemotaxis protein [Clostridia bacterium]
MNIRHKLVGMLALMIIVPLLIMGATSYIKASTLLKESYIESSRLLNEEISAEIDREFSGYLNGVRMLAGSYDARTLISNSENATSLMNAMELYVENYPNAFQAYVGTNDGEIRIFPKHVFESSYDPRQRAWYQLAKTKEEAGWTSMYQDAVTGNWSISGTAPIFDYNKKFIGALATSLDLAAISQDIGERRIGNSGYVFIVDTTGLVIAHPNPENVGIFMPIPAIQEEIAKGQESGYLDYSMADENGKNVDKFAVYKFIPEMGWYVMTSINHDEISGLTSALLKQAGLIGLITLVIAGLIAMAFSGSITKPIEKLVNSMKQVESGDMTVQSDIHSKDELGVLALSFNHMVANVRGLISSAAEVSLEVSDASQNLAGSAEEVNASSEEVTETVEEIAKGASEQANDSQNAVILANQLDGKFAQLGKRSSEISESTSAAQSTNEKGLGVLSDLKQKTDENNNSSHKIADAIQELEQKSRDIGSILESITSIAEQTNLLALNASIEAARAGEHGRGFAVVADEIRKLAEESGKSAERIGSIVRMIQKQTGETVLIMDEFKANSTSQYEAVEEMDRSFTEISSSVSAVSYQMAEVDAYINEMIQDKDAIIEAISNISAVSEETAAASEEVSASMEQQNAAIETVASAAEHLNALSIKLSENIKKFKI